MRGLSAVYRSDPRHFQVAGLSSLLVYGVARLQFNISAGRIAAVLGAALAAQYACAKIWRLPLFDARSPLISGISLCLLLRSNSLWLPPAAALLAILSKFVLRGERKHLFNPTNFALAAMLLLTDRAWIAPGQWGSAAFFAFLLACLGGLVIHRAARSDVSCAFLFFHAAILFGRALWLGDPPAIPLHQLQSGSLLIFAFHMISDPRTTPDSRTGRVLFALLVALGAGFVQFGLFRANGLLWSLALVSPLTPLIDRLLPGERYEWNRAIATTTAKGDAYETNPVYPHSLARFFRRQPFGR